MKLSDVGSYALGNLTRHKMRTALTCAGVAVGVSTLVVMVSLGTGLERMATSQLQKEELTSRITVRQTGSQVNPFQPTSNEGPKGPPITDEVVARLNEIPGVLVAYPDLSSAMTFEAGEFASPAGMTGVPVAALTESYKTALVAGSYWTSDETSGVCVLPTSILRELGFESAEDALGQTIPVTAYQNIMRYAERAEEHTAADGTPYTVVKRERPEGIEFVELEVIGVYNSEEFGYLGTQVLTSVPVAKDLLERFPNFLRGEPEEGVYEQAIVKVSEFKVFERVRERIDTQGFETTSILDVIEMIKIVFVVFQVLLSFFGGIGLFVAFFGIANTMVMAVLERVREIGVLKALGARNRDIRRVFLTEAAIIGLGGGGMGVAIGWVVGKLLNWIAVALARRMAPGTAIDSLDLFYVPLWLVLISLGVATAVAMAAGIYPAWRAARLDPVVALRRE